MTQRVERRTMTPEEFEEFSRMLRSKREERKMSERRQRRAIPPEERLGIITLSDTKKSIKITLDDDKRGELPRYWFITLKAVNRVIDGSLPYAVIRLSKRPMAFKEEEELALREEEE